MRLAVELSGSEVTRAKTWLQYNAVPIIKRQARLEGRVVLRPQIDLSAYECRAVIDWIEIGVELATSTQSRWLKVEVDRTVGGSQFVEPVPFSSVSTTFRIRFQEPQLWQLACAMDAIRRCFGFAVEPTVREIEISIDFSPRVPNPAARDLLFGVLVRHHLPIVDVFKQRYARPRFSKGKGEVIHVLADRRSASGAFETLLLGTEWDRQTPVDATHYAGAQDDPVRWRIMDKVKDRQNRNAGTFIDFDETQKRTRIEVTLARGALLINGLDCLSDLPNFDFTGLQSRFFNFKLITCDLRPIGAHRAINPTIERLRITKFLSTGMLGVLARDQVRQKARAMRRRILSQHLQSRGRALLRIDRTGTGVNASTIAYAELWKD